MPGISPAGSGFETERCGGAPQPAHASQTTVAATLLTAWRIALSASLWRLFAPITSVIDGRAAEDALFHYQSRLALYQNLLLKNIYQLFTIRLYRKGAISVSHKGQAIHAG
jgi:hypothetical protein